MTIWKAIRLTLPIVPFAFFALMGLLRSGDAQPIVIIASLLISILLVVVFFRMMATGKTHRYRSALFILFAFAISFHIIPVIVSVAGSMMLTEEITYAGKAQFCPMTMFMVLLPAVLKGVVIFPACSQEESRGS